MISIKCQFTFSTEYHILKTLLVDGDSRIHGVDVMMVICIEQDSHCVILLHQVKDKAIKFIILASTLVSYFDAIKQIL